MRYLIQFILSVRWFNLKISVNFIRSVQVFRTWRQVQTIETEVSGPFLLHVGEGLEFCPKLRFIDRRVPESSTFLPDFHSSLIEKFSVAKVNEISK